MKSGEVLRVVSTDSGSLKDFPAFCRQTGHELLSSNEMGQGMGREFEFMLMRK